MVGPNRHAHEMQGIVFCAFSGVIEKFIPMEITDMDLSYLPCVEAIQGVKVQMRVASAFMNDVSYATARQAPEHDGCSNAMSDTACPAVRLDV